VRQRGGWRWVLSYRIGASVLGFDPRVEWDDKTPNLDWLAEGMYRRGSGVGGGGVVSYHVLASVQEAILPTATDMT
jgi:hypothetical protein